MKRLVVCADGTWKSRDDSSDATNVEKLHDAVAPVAADGTAQLARYFPGVGTSRLERLRGGAFGVGLSRNVQECYRWLAQEWQPGDELHLFGFSRGAYTVRSLAGMLRNGLELRQESLREATHDDVCDADVTDSYRSVYRLQRPLVRGIGTPPVTTDGRVLRTHESVHPSTVERHRRLTAPPRGPYAPPNLVDHLSRTWPEQRDGAHDATPARRGASSSG